MTSSCCKKWKRIGDFDINKIYVYRYTNKNIQLGYRDWIWHRKLCHAHNEKWKRQITEGRELLNQEREKENYKYLGILEESTNKQVEMKEKRKKSISDERESFSKPSSAAKISSKVFAPYSGLFLEWTKKEIRHVHSRTENLKWYRQTICVKKMGKRIHRHWRLCGGIKSRSRRLQLKRTKKDKIQRPVTALTTRRQAEQQ